MDDGLGLSDTVFENCAASCREASAALEDPARATATVLHGVTDIGARVSEFVSALAIACGVLASAAEGVSSSAVACKRASDLVEDGAVAALADVGGGNGSGGGQR
ncbi:hypothetical protein [Leucobacter salsicius]|uniref:hypothetical protein n=1 Tax=Leucobacter salsicius TaxID=664638 RepID=UPI000349A181|nr:hypothetical protein [Leucobacter salsicius]